MRAKSVAYLMLLGLQMSELSVQQLGGEKHAEECCESQHRFETHWSHVSKEEKKKSKESKKEKAKTIGQRLRKRKREQVNLKNVEG